MRASIRTLALLALGLPGIAGAQQWRTLEVARQLTDAQPLKVSVKYAAGKLELQPAEGNFLYQMSIHYDEQAMDAVHSYDAAGHRLELGLSSVEGGWRALRGMKNHDEGHMSISLSRAVPMDLAVAMGGVEGHLALGGLRLRSLALETGMAGADVSFDAPNPVQMERMSIHVGLGGLKLSGVGNANVGEITINGGMGGLSVDFGPRLGRDVKITSDIAFGELKVELPESVGVMVQGEVKAGKFEHDIDFVRKDNVWYSTNWGQASRRVTIVSQTTLGKLKVDATRE